MGPVSQNKKIGTLRTGIIGCGGALPLHLPGIIRQGRVSLDALCDTRKDIVNRYSKKLKCNGYHDVSTLLAQESLDCVHLLTPPHTHLEIGTAVLRAGCHLLLEKPMALNYFDAKILKKEAESNQRILTIVHNHLFDLPFVNAKKYIENNKSSRLLHLQVKYCLNRKYTKAHTTRINHWVNSLPIPVFGEWLPHTVYLARELLGQLSVDFASIVFFGKHQGICVNVSGERATGEIFILDNVDYELFHVDIYTEDSLLHLNMVDCTLRIMSKRSLPGIGPYMINTLMESLLNLKSICANGLNILQGQLKRKHSHSKIIKSFYDHVSGKGLNPVTPDDGTDVTRTIDDIREHLANNPTKSLKTN